MPSFVVLVVSVLELPVLDDIDDDNIKEKVKEKYA